VHDQFVHRRVGLGAVVAGDGHVHAGGDGLLLQVVQLREDGVGDDDGIGARLLGDGQRHGGLFTFKPALAAAGP
jgi:hypothetical protein